MIGIISITFTSMTMPAVKLLYNKFIIPYSCTSEGDIVYMCIYVSTKKMSCMVKETTFYCNTKGFLSLLYVTGTPTGLSGQFYTLLGIVPPIGMLNCFLKN